MENQHRKISGYRELSAEEIDLMNEIKALGSQFATTLSRVRGHIAQQRHACTPAANDGPSDLQVKDDETFRLHQAEPERWAAMAKTDMQTALMALVRAVAQPGSF
jgi:hypothetical protein